MDIIDILMAKMLSGGSGGGGDPEAIASAVTDWLEENVDPVGSAVVVDSTLTIAGAAADAKATGDAMPASSEFSGTSLLFKNSAGNQVFGADLSGLKLGLNSLNFGEYYENIAGAGLTECKILLKLNNQVTGILNGWIIPVHPGDTLVLDGFEIISRNGYSGVEIWKHGIITDDPTYGAVTTRNGRVLQYSASPTSDNHFPIPDTLELYDDSVAWVMPSNTYVEPGNSYTYPQNIAIYTITEGEEETSGISKWYKDNQDQSFVVDPSCNKTLYWSLFQAVSRMVNGNVLVLGDSITEFSAADKNAKDGLTNRPYYGYGWFTRIARKYNMTCDIYGRASARWWTQASGGSTEWSCVRDVTEICANSNLSADNYQYIVIAYGTNDIMFRPTGFGTLDDAASSAAECSTVAAIKYCISTLQAKFPSATIVVVMPTIIAENHQTNQEAYYELIDKLFNRLGIKRAYPRYNAGIIQSMMRTDGIHLDSWHDNTHDNNTEAVARFSRCLEAAMLEA